MGYIYTLLTAIFLTGIFQTDVPYASVEKAFASNNVSTITSSGKEKMLLTVLGKEGVYSKSQAEQVLKDFFTKKPNGTFKFIFKSKESSDGSFAIGNYEVKGEVYRVTIHFKKESSSYKIESLSIVKE